MSEQPGNGDAPIPLVRALDQNENAKEVVEQSASELLVINTVLKQEIPDHTKVGEIAQALIKTDELETRITETAQELADVNKLLAQEIDQRAHLERELADIKVELEHAKKET